MKNIVLSIWILCNLISCRNYPSEVEEALNLSGENRAELEKVLEYSKKKGKIAYESACFLIENMKYHKSLNRLELDSSYIHFFNQIDSIYDHFFKGMSLDEIKSFKSKEYDSLRITLAETFNNIKTNKKNYKESTTDLKTIHADFLIDNIESALRIWEINGYTYKKDFDFFKEFILPYRTTDEYPAYKRSTIRTLYNKIISDSVNTSIYSKLERYKTYVNKCRWMNKHVKAKEHLGIYDLFIPKFKMDCHNMTTWSNNVLRACGVPTVYEYTPQWIDRERKHFWCVSPDSMGIFQPYTAPDNNIREDWESDIKYAGKVYRKTFEAQKNTPYFLSGEDEYIPKSLRSPLLLDQTFRYHQTITLRMPLSKKIKTRLVYLCMFTKEKLNPVGWGIVDTDNEEIIFNQIPLNILFFPIYFDNEEMQPAAEPFMICSNGINNEIPQPLTTNDIKHEMDVTLYCKSLYRSNNSQKSLGLKYISLDCDTTKKVELVLLRKYPEKRKLKTSYSNMKGNIWIAGNKERGQYDTLHTLDYTPFPYIQEVSLNNNRAYRYYRYISPSKSPIDISHMEFLSTDSKLHPHSTPTALPIFSDCKNKNMDRIEKKYRITGKPVHTGSNPELAFDGNFETYVGSSGIGMDFGKPVKITHVRFAPRNANNMIVIGDNYALMYYNNGWKRLGVQKADKNYLKFSNAPKATLYLLKNLTNGTEELPFFYSKGKQYFLHVNTLDYDSL